MPRKRRKPGRETEPSSLHLCFRSAAWKPFEEVLMPKSPRAAKKGTRPRKPVGNPPPKTKDGPLREGVKPRKPPGNPPPK